VGASLLLEYYRDIPERRTADDPDLFAARMQIALKQFEGRVRARYTEGTLQNRLGSDHATTRRAAVLALGIVGTWESNPFLARMMHDEDPRVARTASENIWALWFRGRSTEEAVELRRVMSGGSVSRIPEGLDQSIRRFPEFAEARNQRAILSFTKGEYTRSIVDCEEVVLLNPWHYGAWAGMGQCQQKLGMTQKAIRAYRMAVQINPTLTHLHDVMESLRQESDEK